jgi:hypothetical protein
MCGLGRGGRSRRGLATAEELIETMTEGVHHRGPDYAGLLVDY